MNTDPMGVVRLVIERAHRNVQEKGEDCDPDFAEAAMGLAQAAEIVMRSPGCACMAVVLDLFEIIHDKLTENRSDFYIFGLANSAHRLAVAADVLCKNKTYPIQNALDEVFESINSEHLIRIAYTDTRYDASGKPVMIIWMVFRDGSSDDAMYQLVSSVPIKKLIESKLAGRMIDLPVFIRAIVDSEAKTIYDIVSSETRR